MDLTVGQSAKHGEEQNLIAHENKFGGLEDRAHNK